MDEKINKLIYGASHLSKNFEGGTAEYWYFPKSYIEENEELQGFIGRNLELQIQDVIRLNEVVPRLEDNRNKLFFIEHENHFLIHDSVRNMIYNFCISKIQHHLVLFKTNVVNEELLIELENQKYFYHYNIMSEVENKIFDGVVCYKSVKNFIKRNIFIRKTVGNGVVLDLEQLDSKIHYMRDNFNFFKVVFT
ncbi:hypothetical protein [Winogradskyella forsetii]|uniref:hypothetical protein n=1 Tax=Winogradskyella forsetii TaxID=2686077 RepID=UPI0015BC3293|nr:hypothetical protein [Winogradskyella forsetii]